MPLVLSNVVISLQWTFEYHSRIISRQSEWFFDEVHNKHSKSLIKGKRGTLRNLNPFFFSLFSHDVCLWLVRFHEWPSSIWKYPVSSATTARTLPATTSSKNHTFLLYAHELMLRVTEAQKQSFSARVHKRAHCRLWSTSGLILADTACGGAGLLGLEGGVGMVWRGAWGWWGWSSLALQREWLTSPLEWVSFLTVAPSPPTHTHTL